MKLVTPSVSADHEAIPWGSGQRALVDHVLRGMLNALHPAHDCTTQRLVLVNRYTPVYEIVRTIPAGMVTTYGAIARAVIVPRGARGVGWALAVCDATIPWWRVVARDGHITSPQADVQRAMLEAEGVPMSGELQVDIRRCLWLP